VAADYYELLGVSPQAGEEEIKRAYRRLARELHPDANPDPHAAERFKEITVAYEVLRDPERRRRYDLFGPDGVKADVGDPFASAGFGGGLGDLFDAFFGGGGFSGSTARSRRAAPPRGADTEVSLKLTFEEAVFGAEKEVVVQAPVVCEECLGSGTSRGTSPSTCSQCNGYGEVRQVRQSLLGQMVTSHPCPRCNGTGQVITSPCPECRGDGRVAGERTLVVEVPAGVDGGSTLRLPGRGAAGPRGGPAGDLYVHLAVATHPRFTREGYDLVHELHLSVTQAALGLKLPFQTLDGVEDLVIPEGTQTGRVFRLRGRGVPHLNGRGRGDLRVQVVVDTPTNLSATQEDLLRRLAAERGEEVAPPDMGMLSKIRSAFK
jgi:molecular chaperone DnaJ